MRFPLIPALFVAVISAQADRLITIPLGRKVPFDVLKFEAFAERSRARTWDRFVGFGLSPEIEIDYHGERIEDGPTRDTVDLSYTYIAPIIDQAPGLSAGVQDVLNRLRDGRRVYLAVTWRESAYTIGVGNEVVEATLGIAQGRRLVPFVGVSLPVSDNFRLLFEHNGIRMASGVELHALKNLLGTRLIFRDRDVMVGANLTLRF